MSTIIDFFSGNFVYLELVLWICLTFGVWGLLIFITYRIYIKSNEYSIMTDTISHLGAWTEDRNPKGWYIFSIAMAYLGVMAFPLFMYFFNKISLISPWGAWIGFVLTLIGNIGIFSMALIPDNEEVPMPFSKKLMYDKVHFPLAVGLFACISLGFLWYGVIIIYDGVFGTKLYNTILLLPPFILLLFVLIMFFYTQIKWQKICKVDDTKDPEQGEGIYSFSLWEWIIALSLFLGMAWVLLLIPN
jgi:hypothetical protein